MQFYSHFYYNIQTYGLLFKVPPFEGGSEEHHNCYYEYVLVVTPQNSPLYCYMLVLHYICL